MNRYFVLLKYHTHTLTHTHKHTPTHPHTHTHTHTHTLPDDERSISRNVAEKHDSRHDKLRKQYLTRPLCRHSSLVPRSRFRAQTAALLKPVFAPPPSPGLISFFYHCYWIKPPNFDNIWFLSEKKD